MASNIMKLAASTVRYGRTVLSRQSPLVSRHFPQLPASSAWISPCANRHMSSQAKFDEAKQRLNSLKEDPGSDVKLQMYALFKQSTIGKPNTKRPGMIDFIGRAKWDAWNGLGDMSTEEAQTAYVGIVDGLLAEEASSSDQQASADQKYECLLVTVEDGLRTITLNRPAKKNAITSKMYLEWVAALEEAAADPHTRVVAVTGAGDYYCSGNDLSNFTNIPESGMAKLAADSKELLYKYVDCFIDFPKPLVAVVNGPAIGVSVTTIALYDAVYSSDKAWFQTPFTSLGQSVEGGASYTFPRIMGTGAATEMLLFNKKITAAEAQASGLVTEVFPHDRLQEEIWPKLRQQAKLPLKSLVYGKALVRDLTRDTLKKANRAECERLEERWMSDDCKAAIMAFFARKK